MDYEKLAGELVEVRLLAPRLDLENELQKLIRGSGQVLNYLYEREDLTTFPSAMAVELNQSSSRIAVVLRDLEKEQLIVRLHSKRDCRKFEISLSNRGRKKTEEIRKEVISSTAELLERLGDEDAKEYVRLQRKLSAFQF